MPSKLMSFASTRHFVESSAETLRRRIESLSLRFQAAACAFFGQALAMASGHERSHVVQPRVSLDSESFRREYLTRTSLSTNNDATFEGVARGKDLSFHELKAGQLCGE